MARMEVVPPAALASLYEGRGKGREKEGKGKRKGKSKGVKIVIDIVWER